MYESYERWHINIHIHIIHLERTEERLKRWRFKLGKFKDDLGEIPTSFIRFIGGAF